MPKKTKLELAESKIERLEERKKMDHEIITAKEKVIQARDKQLAKLCTENDEYVKSIKEKYEKEINSLFRVEDKRRDEIRATAYRWKTLAGRRKATSSIEEVRSMVLLDCAADLGVQ